MTKRDLKKELKQWYAAPASSVSLVTVPALNYLMADGRGDPNTSPEFKAAVAALYPLAYALKFMVRKSEGIDYGVMPLEGLWWAGDIRTFSMARKGDWRWTVMIMQPEWISSALVETARAQVGKKHPALGLDAVRFERLDEGPAAQLLHTGPFSEEGPTIQRLHDWIAGQKYQRRGKHHEIYLNDFRKTAPARLKTIIRQPVAR
jgi:hypothetical protein